jgi:NAD(P)-dependent dehydrogenase (short-subunit alcohol dehydrogenase family)
LAFPLLRLELDNLDGSKRYSPTRAYYHSKLAMMLFTTSLAARHPAGPSCSIVRVPAVQVDLERLPAVPAWQKYIYLLKRRFALTPEQMADTYIHLALDGEDADYNGAIVDENRARVRWSKRLSHPATARSLWQRSAELTGFLANDRDV